MSGPAKYTIFDEATGEYFCGYRNVGGAWRTSKDAADAYPTVLRRAESAAAFRKQAGGKPRLDRTGTVPTVDLIDAQRARIAELEKNLENAKADAADVPRLKESLEAASTAGLRLAEKLEIARKERDAHKADAEAFRDLAYQVPGLQAERAEAAAEAWDAIAEHARDAIGPVGQPSSLVWSKTAFEKGMLSTYQAIARLAAEKAAALRAGATGGSDA